MSRLYWGSDARKEGARDYERRQHPDRELYEDHWSDRAHDYRDGYDAAKRDEERRQERREEEAATERAAERRRKENRRIERQQEEAEQERQYQEELERRAYEQQCPVEPREEKP
jgi:hypothetical protein